MYKKTIIFSGILILAALLNACSTPAAAQDVQTSQRTLSVNGTGKAYLSPDMAYLMVGVHTEGSDAAEVVASNSSKTQQVKDVLLGYGIEPLDIQTINFSIWPNQQYNQDGIVTGIIYMVDNTLRVTLRAPEQIGDILNAVIDAGANRIESVQFDVADKSEALSEARKAALDDAEYQASELAGAAGLTLGQIKSISTTGGGMPYPMFEGMGGGGMGAAEASVPVSPGQLVVTVEVFTTYELLP